LTEYLGEAREPVAAAPDQPRILPDNKCQAIPSGRICPPARLLLSKKNNRRKFKYRFDERRMIDDGTVCRMNGLIV
jgi:hypothetical protein